MIRAVALVIVALAGCGASRGDLHEAARSLVPPRSETVEEIEADCVELAQSPSCVHVYYVVDLSLRQRIRATERAAADGGWTTISRELLQGGAQLRFRRDALVASVFLRRAACRRAPTKDCSDAVLVERT